jgi:antitoxin component YwqK of YwqJK toxin-antitoxin module
MVLNFTLFAIASCEQKSTGMKKNDFETSKSPSINYEGLDELKKSCPAGTVLSGPVGKDGQVITVNGQVEAACVSTDGIRNGLFIRWYENGKKAVHGTFLQGNKSGEWTYWSIDGHITGKGTFHNDKPEGKWLTWFENGETESEGRYENGVQDGEFKYWDDKKNISKILHYNKGNLVKTIYYKDGKELH